MNKNTGYLDSVQKLEDLNAHFIDFIDEVLEIGFEGGDLDGGDIQALAERHGLLRPVTVKEPCGEGCVCREYNDFPCRCYRKTYLPIAKEQQT